MTAYEKAAGWLSRTTNKVAIGANVLGALVVLFLVVAINIDVFARTVLIAPIRGVHEIVEMSLVAIVFLQLADVVRTGRLTRSDAFLNKLVGSRPEIGMAIKRFFSLLSAVFMALIVYTIFPATIEAYHENAYVGTEGVFTAPEWPLLAIMVFGSLLCMVRWLISAFLPASIDEKSA